MSLFNQKNITIRQIVVSRIEKKIQEAQAAYEKFCEQEDLELEKKKAIKLDELADKIIKN